MLGRHVRKPKYFRKSGILLGLLVILGGYTLQQFEWVHGSPKAESRPGDKKRRGKATKMAAVCRKLESQSQLAQERKLSEYPALRDQIRSMSPLLKDDMDLLKRAHRNAIAKTNDQVTRYLIDNGEVDAARYFSKASQQHLSLNQLSGDEHDLEIMLSRVLRVSEGEVCANLYLELFYTNYVKNLDLFGTIVFGSTNTASQPDTLGLKVELGAVAAAAPSIERVGSRGKALWVTMLRHEQSQSDLDQALLALENHARQSLAQARRGIVLDLMSSGGEGAILAQRIHASLERGWGNLPLLVLVDSSTRGVAAVIAYELATKGRSEILGMGSSTYGYGRRLEQRAISLVAGVSTVNITVGAAFLPVFLSGFQGLDEANRDGFRLRIKSSNQIAVLNSEEIVDRADAWSETQIGPEAPGSQISNQPAQESAPSAPPVEAHSELSSSGAIESGRLVAELPPSYSGADLGARGF